MTINSCNISQNIAESAGALWLDTSTHTIIYDVDIVENHCINAGTVFVNKATVDVHGGNLSNNSASRGGAFQLWLKGMINFYNGTITQNNASMGGAFDLDGNTDNVNCVLNIYGGTITENTADFGGGIHTTAATVNIYDGVITDNRATDSHGGGIHALDASILTIKENAHVYNNIAETAGDDIYFSTITTGGNPAVLDLSAFYHDVELAECKHPITGWYVDGIIDGEKTPRWNAHGSDEERYFTLCSESIFTEDIALKAAHGLFGNLTVSKTVTGDAGDPTENFTFTVTLSDTSITGTCGDMNFVNGVAEFTLKHGESMTAENLPANIAYEVSEAEANADGYTTTTVNASGTIIGEETVTAAFTNTKEEVPPAPESKTGNLTVSKTVSGNAGSITKDFSFTVTLDNTSINGTYGEMVFSNGVATFTLRHNESKTGTNLPEGVKYTVVESDIDGYRVTVNGIAGTTTSGSIEADETTAVVFNNYKESGSGETPDGPDDPVTPPDEPDDPVTPPDGPDDPVTSPDEPTTPSKPDKTYDDVPKTGDTSHTSLWFVLMCISAVGLIITSRKIRYKGVYSKK